MPIPEQHPVGVLQLPSQALYKMHRSDYLFGNSLEAVGLLCAKPYAHGLRKGTPCLGLAGPVGHEHKVLNKLWSLAYRCGRSAQDPGGL